MQQLLRGAVRAFASLVLAAACALPSAAQAPPSAAQAPPSAAQAPPSAAQTSAPSTVAPVAPSSVPPAPSAAQAAADKVYLAKDYARAADAFRAVVAAEPANAQAWYRLGVSLQMLGRFDEAQRDLGVALERGFHPFSVHYRLVQIALKRRDTATANAELEKAVATQPTAPETLSQDEELAPLRGTPAFVALVAKQELAYHPCRHDAAYRALDFWIGDWVVLNASGSEMGRSRIEPALDGCAIEETWTGAYGGNGKSLTSYDLADKRWVQHYVTSSGSYNDYAGQAVGTSIVMIAPARTAGKPVAIRMTFTPLDDGRVRQQMETSSDGGATWALGFDGYYAKVKPPKP
jgi:tetratricopeptide (TPR) repeat protein